MILYHEVKAKPNYLSLHGIRERKVPIGFNPKISIGFNLLPFKIGRIKE
jgi:hypothetical protein